MEGFNHEKNQKSYQFIICNAFTNIDQFNFRFLLKIKFQISRKFKVMIEFRRTKSEWPTFWRNYFVSYWVEKKNNNNRISKSILASTHTRNSVLNTYSLRSIRQIGVTISVRTFANVNNSYFVDWPRKICAILIIVIQLLLYSRFFFSSSHNVVFKALLTDFITVV